MNLKISKRLRGAGTALAIMLLALPAVPAQEKPTATEQKHPDAIALQLPKSRLPVVFEAELLHSIQKGLVADLEYMAAFATAERIVPAPEDTKATYRGTTYLIREQVVLEFPSSHPVYFQPPIGPIWLIEIKGQKAVFINAETSLRYEEGLKLVLEDRVRREKLHAFLRAVRDVDGLLRLTPDEKKKMLPIAGKDFTVALFDMNVELLRGYTFYDPPLLTIRKGKEGLVGAKMIGIKTADKKMYIQEIMYYEGVWTFGYGVD